MKELVPIENEKQNAYNKILRFMTEGDVVLSAKEEVVLDRWIYCDVLLRQRKFRAEDIADKIKDKFGVSKFTAQNDITQTQMLFGASRKISKPYALSHHAEDIALQIERIKHDKTLAHLLPKMYDSYTKAIAAIPEDIGKNVLPPPVFIFNVVAGQDIKKPMQIEEAKEKAKLFLNPDAGEPIDFEDAA